MARISTFAEPLIVSYDCGAFARGIVKTLRTGRLSPHGPYFADLSRKALAAGCVAMKRNIGKT